MDTRNNNETTLLLLLHQQLRIKQRHPIKASKRTSYQWWHPSSPPLWRPPRTCLQMPLFYYCPLKCVDCQTHVAGSTAKKEKCPNPSLSLSLSSSSATPKQPISNAQQQQVDAVFEKCLAMPGEPSLPWMSKMVTPENNNQTKHNQHPPYQKVNHTTTSAVSDLGT